MSIPADPEKIQDEAVIVHEEHAGTVESLAHNEEPSKNPVEAKTERKFVRKIDFTILPLLSIMYFLASLDRGDIGNAAVAGMSRDLHLTSQMLSNCSAMFFVVYIVFQLPGDLFLRVLTPPIQMALALMTWGLFTALLSQAKSYAAIVGLRVCIGVGEAFLQAGPLYLTFWYKRNQLATRASIFFSMSALAGAFNGWDETIFVLFHLAGLTICLTAHTTWYSRTLGIVENSMTIPLEDDQPDLDPSEHGTGADSSDSEDGLVQQGHESDEGEGNKADDKNIGKGKGPELPKVHKRHRAAVEEIPVTKTITDKIYTSKCAYIWARIIVDEAHHLRNPNTLLAESIFQATKKNIHFLNIIGFTKRAGILAMMNIFGQCFSIIGQEVYSDAPHYYRGNGFSLASMVIGGIITGLYMLYLSKQNARKLRNQNTDEAISQRHLDIEEIGDAHPDFMYYL
ncbi:hypothetical protein B7494_g7317 [Chlorociboria aeruginascens]|nr:hypothetical protein B7494_g7317 [Chlorociboria aeruginascens]